MTVARRKAPRPKRTFTNRPLAGLAKLKKRLRKSPSAQPEERKQPVSGSEETDDDKLFGEAMHDVERLSADGKHRAHEPRVSAVPSPEEEEAQEVMQALRDLVEGEAPLSISETDEAIEGSVEGMDPRILRKLRKGEFSIQDHLDLHGLTRVDARVKVEEFLLKAISQGKRCVLIIHGRGLGSKDRKPVLKNALMSWFTRRALRKKVLAFTTARSVDGGAGAVYVLLRKYQPPRS